MLGLVQRLLAFFVAVQGYTECKWGLHGEHCNLTCPQNCALLPPLHLPYCDTDTGKCSEGCQRGWHGDLCNQDCSRNCLEQTCNHQTGHCTLGCSGNNAGHFCNDTRDCGRGLYGDICQHPCSRNCLEERCHHTSGACILGCSGTYTGEFCNTTKVVNNREDANSLTDKVVPVVLNVATAVGVTVTVTVTVAVAVTAAVTVAVTVAVIVFLKWRRRTNRKRGQTNSSLSPEAELSEVESCMNTDGELHKEELPMYSGDLIEEAESEVESCMNTDDLHKEELPMYSGDLIEEAELSEVESCMITDDLHKEELPMYSGDLIEEAESSEVESCMNTDEAESEVEPCMNTDEAESSEDEPCMNIDGDSHMGEPSIYSGDYIEDWEVVSMKMSNNYSKVKNTLKTYGRVTMSGAPGGGKTDLALKLGTRYRDEGYEVVSVNDILKFNLQHYVNQGKDMCFIFLDVFKKVKLPKHTTLLQRLLHELQSHLEKHNSDNEKKLYAIFTTNSYSDTGQIPPLGEVGDYFFSGPPFINFNVEFHG